MSSNSKFVFLVILAVLLAAVVMFFRFNGAGTEILWNLSDGGRFMLPLVSIAALIDSINPCAFSILLLTIAFLFSLGQMRSGILRIGGSYILGVFVIYVLIGLGILQALHLFNTPHFMAKVGASLLIVFGAINVINEFFPSFPIKLRIPHAAHRKIAELMEKASVPTAFFLGVLVGLCEFPCTGGPYLMVLGLLHDSATYFRGLGYLLLYNLIFVLPLVIILFIASEEKLLAKVRAWQQKENRLMRFGGGVAMVVLGMLIFLF
ncbi:MAG: cytochrome c biogenesis protein CcdA [Patescibacteria group bacterium]